jgi:hypothetical protein
MTSLRSQSRIIAFSIIGALIIVGAAWLAKGSESNDAWLYVFSIWMILFSAFQVHTPSATPSKLPKLVFGILAGAAVIVIGAWWANGAEHAWLFLTSIATLIVSFFILAPWKE